MSVEPPPLLAIFDHDGVLVDSLAFHQQAWVELGREAGLPITAEFIHETFGMTNPAIFRRLFGDDLHPDKAKRYTDLKEGAYRKLAKGNITLMEGVQELLDELTRAGVHLAIGSSSVLPNLELTIDECGLQGRFAAIASLEDIAHGKPNPEVFLVAASRVGIPPSRAVVFEDALVGIQAAKAAGMKAVGVATSHDEQSLWEAGADEVVKRLSGYQVEKLLARLAS